MLAASKLVRTLSTRVVPKAAPRMGRASAAVVGLVGGGCMVWFTVGASPAESFSLPATKDDVDALRVDLAGKTNSAFVFIKPHACNEDVAKLVRATFRAAGIRITSESSLTAATIDRNMLIDNHYGAIAAKAVKLHPSELHVPAKGLAGFEKMFGETWEDALAAGKVYNAKQACEKLGVDGEGLDALWAKTKRNVDCIKFGGGFYCAQIDGIYIMNGFYMSMRSQYCTPPARIHTFTVQWPADTLSWEDFRGRVLGATDPSEASKGSLRRRIYDDYKKLGLPGKPDTGLNGMHASASPFEAMAERINWCGATVETDAFGKGLLAAGVDRAVIIQWTQDPQATLDGKTGSLFDHFEDKDADVILADAKRMV